MRADTTSAWLEPRVIGRHVEVVVEAHDEIAALQRPSELRSWKFAFTGGHTSSSTLDCHWPFGSLALGTAAASTPSARGNPVRMFEVTSHGAGSFDGGPDAAQRRDAMQRVKIHA